MMSLAWRNLWRQRRRSFTTLGAVALVVALSILYYAVGGASVNSLYQNLTGTIGQVQVHIDGYRDIRAADELLIRDATAVRERIDATVTATLAAGSDATVIAALDVPTLLAGETRSRAIVLVGQEFDGIVGARLGSELIAGRLPAEGDTGAIVLGAALADALAVGLDDEVYAYAPGSEGYGAAAYTVIGLLDFDDPKREVVSALVTLDAARELYAPDAASRFEIHLPGILRMADDDVSDRLEQALGSALPELQSEAWIRLDPLLAAAIDILDPMMLIVSLIFFVLAGLLVVNTVYLGMMERIREFGIILSLGASGRRVMAMVILESVLLCASGALVGVTLGLAAVARLAQGFSVPGLEEYYATFGMNPVLYASITPFQVLFATLFALIIGVVAALWPASLAARLDPAEAMRFGA